MKKIVTLLLCFIGIFSFVACNINSDKIAAENEPENKSQEETEEASLSDLPYNDYNMVALEDVKIELGVFPINEDFTPLKLYKEQPIELDENDKESIQKNLSGTVWEDIEFFKPDIAGLISLKTTNDTGGIISTHENYEYSKEFIEKSGLLEIFSEKGIYYKIDESSIDSFATFYKEYKDGEFITNSYIRLNFYKEKYLSQCKIYSMKSIYYKTIDRIYIDEAIANPCFAYYKDLKELNQQKTLKIIGAKVMYSHLVPLYEFTVKTNNPLDKFKIYTPCISNQEIIDDEILYNQFLRFLEEGVCNN